MLAPLPPENDTIYWVDMGLSTISRAKRDQTWREDVVTNGIGRVEGIAVDWIAGELWEGWGTAGEADDWGSGVSGGGGVRRRGRQEQMGRSGGSQKAGGDEVHESPHAPRAPCLPPSSGNIYCTDQGFDVIEVARLNGSFRYVVISQGLDKPRAITVHPEKG